MTHDALTHCLLCRGSDIPIPGFAPAHRDGRCCDWAKTAVGHSGRWAPRGYSSTDIELVGVAETEFDETGEVADTDTATEVNTDPLEPTAQPSSLHLSGGTSFN